MARRKKVRPRISRSEQPPGFSLEHRLAGHTDTIFRISWSPDGARIATPSKDTTVRIWDAGTGACVAVLKGHTHGVNHVAWSPDGKTVASASFDQTIRIWDVATQQQKMMLTEHRGDVRSVAWSNDGAWLASASADQTVRLWDTAKWRQHRVFPDQPGAVNRVAWSADDRLAWCLPSGFLFVWDPLEPEPLQLSSPNVGLEAVAWSRRDNIIAAAGVDGSVSIYRSNERSVVLEGHSDVVTSVSFSRDGRLLASKSWDRSVRLWRTDRWEEVSILNESSSLFRSASVEFSPTAPRLATLDDRDCKIRIWSLDETFLLGDEMQQSGTIRYSNAKVVLVGDTAVGKTALGNVLIGHVFKPTESTHGRTVWTLSSETTVVNGIPETREVLLWDLAGQPGYRLFHRQHLDDVAVALVLFDSRSEVEPFAGVAYWARSLDEAAHGFPLVKILVAARVDRGGISVSRNRVDELCTRYGFAGFYETSAREGLGVNELRDAIAKAIRWDLIPAVSAPTLFYDIKRFLIQQKEENRILIRSDDVLEKFLPKIPEPTDSITEAFDACVARLGVTGFLRSLRFANLVLLQPELLDKYCAWLAHAAREEPDGAGFISEKQSKSGDFAMDKDRVLRNRHGDEQLVLTATVEEVVARGIAWREDTELGPMLVFPSELRADSPFPGGYRQILAFRFDGPVAAVYATLAVKLLNSLVFKKRALYRHAAIFTGPLGGTCGFAVEHADEIDETRGRLIVFAEDDVSSDVQLLLQYARHQLLRLALSNTVYAERPCYCSKCGQELQRAAVEFRRKAGHTTIACAYCEEKTEIRSLMSDEVIGPDIAYIDVQSREQQEIARALSIMPEKEKAGKFDVFLCYHSADQQEAERIAGVLRELGVLPWIDAREIKPGDEVVTRLDSVLGTVPSALIMIGDQLGAWEQHEFQALLNRRLRAGTDSGVRPVRLIPMVLSSAKAASPGMPELLRSFHSVDLRDPESFDARLRRLAAVIREESDR